jgi:iron complex transport system ATP-binding protein
MLERASELLAELGVESFAGRNMDTLSTGEARRVLIARALVHDPPMLVLDEPCDGLDPRAAFHFLRLLRDIAAAGRTLVLVTHHIDDIVPEVERVILVRDGRILRDGAKGDLLRDDVVSALYGIPAHVEERDGWYRLW